MKKVTGYASRKGTPVTLADQITAWLTYREGDSVDTVAAALQRTKPQIRAILFGSTNGDTTA